MRFDDDSHVAAVADCGGVEKSGLAAAVAFTTSRGSSGYMFTAGVDKKRV